MRTLGLLLGLTLPTFAAETPVITCGKDTPSTSFMELRESDSEYIFDIRETLDDPEQSIAASLHLPDLKKGKRYHLEYRFAKASNCHFTDDPQLLACYGSSNLGEISVVEVASGERTLVPLTLFLLGTETSQEERVTDWDELKKMKRVFWSSYLATNRGSARRTVEVTCTAKTP